jgi:prepilin-type processing-associated H-X9-DG protein
MLRYQAEQIDATACLSNQRRIATALLLYAQDHEGNLPPPSYQTAGGQWRHWAGILLPYLEEGQRDECPAIPLAGARDHFGKFPYDSTYALNSRFFGVFGPGPFPLDNLELPARTALLVEAGPFRDGQGAGPWVMSAYLDVAEWPRAHPSVHGGRMNVAAADGHAKTIRVENHAAGTHDGRYGRIGGQIYNWNGGHPNGDTSGPPRE